jgi:hypothetical protein
MSEPVAETTDEYGHRVTIDPDGSRTTELDPITIEGDPNASGGDPYAASGSSGGGADAGAGGGWDGGADGGDQYLDPDSYSTGPTLSDSEKEGLLTVGAHVVGEVLDSTPIGIALHTITMESDNPQAMEAQREEEFNSQLQEQTDAQRAADMTDSLPSHIVPMDANAVPEQDEEVFQP